MGLGNAPGDAQAEPHAGDGTQLELDPLLATAIGVLEPKIDGWIAAQSKTPAG